MNFTGAASVRGHVAALLGPTNTGKTHLAVETMLSHASGIIGFPLRLLAREVYDRVVERVGRSNVALVTGEEKIVPANPHYFLCTVEAMPLGRSFDFLAVDEIQLAGDPERGHVFTDRLMNARGLETTLFLGADTARPLIQRMLPDALFTGRPRLSKLSYTGRTKLSRMPRRSAVVAFSATDVYEIAELMRRQRGGAAVVLGALSPRTRNAQVAMYQAGEVDFLVATDAIGMGLNMDIDHVAFAGSSKFDGARRRGLTPAEMGQIAGRAGRFMSDGTFGVTADAGDLKEDVVTAIEDHQFDPLHRFHWRAGRLNYDGVRELIRSLEAPTPFPWLVPPRDAQDLRSLKDLLKDDAVRDAVSGNREQLITLWDVCQIPDFRKTMHDSHVRLLGHVFRHLSDKGEISRDWIARQLQHLDRVDGDLDTLQSRLAHVRTWTYISHRVDWVDDPAEWQDRTRVLEDRLSDALHAALTQRFVDRRTAALVKRLRDADDVQGAVDAEGDVTVDGEFVGRIDGLRFAADRSALENKAMKAAVQHVLSGALTARARTIMKAGDDAFALKDDGGLVWQDQLLARLASGPHLLRPDVRLVSADQLAAADVEGVTERLRTWLTRQIKRRLGALVALEDAPFSAGARGVAYQMIESLGVLDRREVAEQMRQFDPKDHGRFKYRGITLGRSTLFSAALLKPEATRWRQILHRCAHDSEAELIGTELQSMSVDRKADNAALMRAGYRNFNGLAVRVDILERFSAMAFQATRKGQTEADHDLMSLLGGGVEAVAKVLNGLGYQTERGGEEGSKLLYRTRGKGQTVRKQERNSKSAKGTKRVRRAQVPVNPASPFAVLAGMKLK